MGFLGINIKYWAIFIGIFILLLFSTRATIKNSKLFMKVLYLGLIMTLVGVLYKYFNFIFYPTLLLYLVLPATFFGCVLALIGSIKPKAAFDNVLLHTNKGDKVAVNVFAHTAIFAASRHGKTASLVLPYAKHFAEYDFAGVYYDYKNGELYEGIKPLFPNNHYVFAVHRPDITKRINIISPSSIYDEKDVNSLVYIFLDNLLDLEKQGDFFVKTATSLLSGVILKLALDHPEMCYLPHVCVFLQAVDFALKKEEAKGLKDDVYDTFAGLKKFLYENDRARMQASSFLMGLASERQTAGVISTLSNALREVSYPDAFWALSGDEVNLAINKEGNRKVLAIINEPVNDHAISPLLATVIHATTRAMMERNRKPSFLMMDEGVTIKQKNLGRIVATMASFNIAVLYCIQDMKQGEEVYGATRFKSILANFSTLYFGRANEAETAKYYEQYSPLIKEKNYTRSRSSGSGSSSSTSVSEREIPKYRITDFTNLKKGTFLMINNGKTEMLKFNLLPNMKNEPFPPKTDEMNNIVLQNYNKIIKQMRDFALSLGITE